MGLKSDYTPFKLGTAPSSRSHPSRRGWACPRHPWPGATWEQSPEGPSHYPSLLALPQTHSPFGVQPTIHTGLASMLEVQGAGRDLPQLRHLQELPGLLWALPLWRKRGMVFTCPSLGQGPSSLRQPRTSGACLALGPWSYRKQGRGFGWLPLEQGLQQYCLRAQGSLGPSQQFQKGPPQFQGPHTVLGPPQFQKDLQGRKAPWV